jgi:uncharacterized protein (TIGR02246 family)
MMKNAVSSARDDIGLEGDRRAISAATAALLRAVNASDVDGVLAVWTDDGVLMPPGHAAVRGKAALDEYFRNLFAKARFAFVFTASDVEIFGDVATERVSYRVSVQPAHGAPFQDAGKGLHVYRREKGGQWKMAVDIWNSDRPSPR